MQVSCLADIADQLQAIKNALAEIRDLLEDMLKEDYSDEDQPEE